MLKDSSSWCPELYKGLFVHPIGKDEIGISPCCLSTTKKIIGSEFDFENNEYLTLLRNTPKHNACNRCWETESTGGYSKRQAAIDYYKIAPADKIELNSLEYNVTWACNLACIMCGPHYSSTWAKELNIKDNRDKITQAQNKIIEKLDKSKITRIHFNGGEPLINDEHTNILNQIETLSECKVTYNTNGTILPSDRTLKVWQDAKMVRIFFSIDATGDAFEYIRWPARWDNIQSNIEWYITNSPSNVMFALNVTVGAYNLFEMIDLYKWYSDVMLTNREGDESEFHWQPAHNFDPRWINLEAKKDAIEMLGNRPVLTQISEYLKNTGMLESSKWIEKLDILDQRRNLNWRQVLKIGKYYK